MRWEILPDFSESDRELINQLATKYEDLLVAQQKGSKDAIKTARSGLTQIKGSLLEAKAIDTGALQKIDNEARRIVTSPVKMEQLRIRAEQLSKQLDARGIYGPR